MEIKMETVARCPLINTARLKPFRQRLNRTIMTITDTGCVSMEIMSHLNSQTDSPEVAKELFHVSADGTQIEVYQSTEGVSAIDGCPVASQPYKIYTYPNLPEKQWRKYQHCYKFIQVVKSRTPKIVLVTEHARCKLMENFPHPDFQACFTDGVTIHLSESKITVTDTFGNSLAFDATSVNSHVNASTLEKVDFAKKCQVQCLDIQDSVSRLKSHEQNAELFPIVVGTSSSPFKLSVPMSSKENVVNLYSSGPPPEPSCPLPVANLPSFSQQSLPLTHCLANSKPLDSKHFLSKSNSSSQEGCTDCNLNLYPKQVTSPKEESRHEDLQIQNWHCHENDSTPCSALDFKGTHQTIDSSCDCMMEGFSTFVTPQTPKKNSTQGFVFSPERHLFQVTPCHPPERHPPSFDMLSGEATHLNLPQFFNASCNISQPSHHFRVNHPADCYVDDQVQTPDGPDNIHHHMNKQVNIYQTPTKSSTVMPYHPQCYSVDSTRHRRYFRDENRPSLTLGALVDETELRTVRKNLFSDTALEEPLVKPMPLSDPESLREDFLSFKRAPSLELSFCNEVDVPQCINNDLGQASLNVFTPLPHSQSRSSHSQSAQVEHTTQIYEEPNLNSWETISYVKESCSNLQSSSVNNNAKENNLLIEVNKVMHNDAASSGTILAIQTQDCPRPNICSSPVKSVSLQQRSCPSPLRPSPLKMAGAPGSLTCSTGIVTGNSTGNIPIETSFCQNCSAYSTNSPLSSASWNGSSHSHEPFYKSDPRNYGKVNLGANFLPFASSERDRNSNDINRHPHLRNSLDMSASSYYSDSPSSSPSSGSDPIRQVFVPYSGWASFYASGAVWILYNDGTQLGVRSTETTIIYVDQDGTQKRYRNSDVLPEIIKMKLEKLPKIIEMLMKSPPVTTGAGIQS